MVQNITSALKPLETEGVDARLNKKPDEGVTEREQRSQTQDEDVPPSTDIGEYSILSVKSILLFLEDFLELRLSSTVSDNSRDGEQLSFAPWFSKRQSNDSGAISRSKKAVKAYAKAAKTIRKHSNEPQKQEKQLEKTEIKGLYSLIRVLRDLQDDGVGYLKIDSQKTFLDGIYFAVDQAKAKRD